jgi:conjugative relaxase-like TrwC/TraI family protein
MRRAERHERFYGFGVLSVAPMNAARAAYHERSLGLGLDDYYSEWGERPGFWWGGGAELLGLQGYVEPGSIVSLVNGRDPRSQGHLRRPTSSAFVSRRVFDPESGVAVERQVEQKRVGGWDFALSAPKSISLALAFGDHETRSEILASHRAGVEAALHLLEGEAVRVRVGAQGASRHETHGLLAVVIEHAWARAVSEEAAPDPQLHTHVVVANMAKSREDDSAWWRTLDMQPVLREWNRAVGATYQAVLRHEVSMRLGWEWTAPRNGLAELKAWPSGVLRAFSRRREQIEAFLAGETSWARAQAAATTTRQAKNRQRDESADLDASRTRLGEFLDDIQVAALLAPGTHRPVAPGASRIGQAFAEMLGERGLTERASSFTRGDVVRELAYTLGYAPDSEALVAAADSFIALRDVIPLDDRRFTTSSLQAADEGIARLAQRPAPRQLVLTRAAADAGIARTEGQLDFALSEEQRALVHGVTADPNSITLVRAVAGSGKTTTLAAIAEAYACAGIPVAGVAPTGAAARVMSEAGIPARTVDRALLDRERALRAGILPTPGVVLVDEAGTIGTRTLAQLAEAVAAADAKLVLVGDDAQLPSVAAGHAYANLLEREQAVHSLETPRRFLTAKGERDLAEAHALASLRSGTLDGAAAYLSHKQSTRTITALARPEALATAAWWHAAHAVHGTDPARVALIARSHELRGVLNRAARNARRTTGRLGPDIYGLGPIPLAVGDIVVCRRNDMQLEVTNGARGQVTQIADDYIALEMTDQRRIMLPIAYAQAGDLEHGYAITGHLSQGATFAAAMVVSPPHHHSQQWSYTALSRSRSPTELILITDTPRDQPTEHAAPIGSLTTADALTRLATCLTRDELATARRSRPIAPIPRRQTLNRSR